MFGIHSQVQETLQTTVEELLQQQGIDRPPVDAIAVAERLGMEIRLNRQQRQRGLLVRLRSQVVICVRPEPRTERYQWTIAHEIGEHLMPRLIVDSMDLADQVSAQLRESIANRFAMMLLVPAHWLEFDSQRNDCDLFELKALYQTASYEVISLRLLDLDPPTIISIFDNGNLQRRSGNLPFRPPQLQAVECAAQQQANCQARSCQLTDRGLIVQAWPIHEPDWKREILRTVLDYDDPC